MQISINTAEASTDELTALIALCASLGGRLPATYHVGTISEAIDKVRDTVEFSGYAEAPPEAEEHLAALVAGDDAPPPPPPADAPTTDSNGLPWDARIHSESKATNADGSWRKRRGVDDTIYATVLAELTGSADDAPPPPPSESPAPLEPTDDTPPPPPSNAPTADEPSAPAAAAGATGAGSPSAFEAFPAFVSAVSKHGKTYAELNELAGIVGVAAFKDMKDHADKWDAFYAML